MMEYVETCDGCGKRPAVIVERVTRSYGGNGAAVIDADLELCADCSDRDEYEEDSDGCSG